MKERSDKPMLEILVQTDPQGTVEFESEIGHVKMIPFTGTVDCENFHGVHEFACVEDMEVMVKVLVTLTK